jgi:heme iron utilization protein
MRETEPATDPPKEPGEVAATARQLLRRRGVGVLATALGSDAGRPYASLVTYACDHDARPIFLFSRLADHTRNLDTDPRASLLVEAASGRPNPQTGPRLGLVGTVTASDEPRHRARFLARHPGAAQYAGFADFRIYSMAVEKAHWVGGFARAQWLPARRLMTPDAAATALAEAEDGIVRHMNDDHAEALDLYARVLLRRRSTGWRLAGADADGLDLMRDGRTARLDFPRPVADAAGMREVLVGLAAEARARSAGSGT